MGFSPTFTKWTFLTSGSVYQVLTDAHHQTAVSGCKINLTLFSDFFRCQICTRTGILNGWIKPPLSFQTMVLVSPETAKASGTVGRSTPVGPAPFHSGRNRNLLTCFQHLFRIYSPLIQGTMRANGKQPTASRAWVTFVKWPADRTRNPRHLPVSQTPRSLLSCCVVTALLITASFFSDSHCDAGYLLYGNFCYYFEAEDVKNWHDAEARCVKEQGHLVSFHSQEELSFLTGEQRTRLLKYIDVNK